MSTLNYGVLKGTVVDRRLATGGHSPHYEVRVVDGATHFRLAINVRSKLWPSELRYVVATDFSHVLLDELRALQPGWHELPRRAGGMALDFIRSNLFDENAMRVLPYDLPGPDNDLNEQLDHYVQRALGDARADVYAFGERWGPEPDRADEAFDFRPGNGIHKLHMNQSNVGEFVPDDATWQDGALLLHFPDPEQWVGIFLAFQSQTWHTDDDGHQISDGPIPADRAVRIVGALVNAVESPEHEFATLLNTTAADRSLDGWQLLDRGGNRQALHGAIGAGEALRVALAPPLALSNRGGILTLLDAAGLKVDGVGWTGQQAHEPGRTLVF